MVTATFRFYGELNDLLAPQRRRRDITVPCAREATARHMIEALGVPHTEVELIKAQVQDRLAPGVLVRYDQFKACALCGRVFWDGAHRQRLRVLLDAQA